MQLEDSIIGINTQKELAEFVRLLLQDFQKNPTRWENADLETFLEALATWIDDMDGYYTNHALPIPQQPEWRTIAEMLCAATKYE